MKSPRATLPQGLASELLQRRLHILQAERDFKADNACIGVARGLLSARQRYCVGGHVEQRALGVVQGRLGPVDKMTGYVKAMETSDEAFQEGRRPGGYGRCPLRRS